MATFYSPKRNGFFDDIIHGKHEIEVVDKAALAKAIEAAGPTEEEAELPDAEKLRLAKTRVEAIVRDPPTKMIDNPDCQLPDDAFEISDADWAGLMEELSTGKVLVNDNGRPAAVEPTIDVEEQLAIVRRRRDQALKETDWTQQADAALTAAKRKLWADHRQALRDLPGMAEKAVKAGKAADSVPFPKPPS